MQIVIFIYMKKRLKMPKSQLEAVNRRTTDNTMSKRKRTNGQIIINKTLHSKTEDWSTRTPLKKCQYSVWNVWLCKWIVMSVLYI